MILHTCKSWIIYKMSRTSGFDLKVQCSPEKNKHCRFKGPFSAPLKNCVYSSKMNLFFLSGLHFSSSILGFERVNSLERSHIPSNRLHFRVDDFSVSFLHREGWVPCFLVPAGRAIVIPAPLPARHILRHHGSLRDGSFVCSSL